MPPIGSNFLIFDFISMSAYVCSGKGMRLQIAYGGQKRTLEPGSCESPKLVLGSKLWSSKREERPLNLRTVFPASHTYGAIL